MAKQKTTKDGLSKYRLLELKYFCLQYPEKKSIISSLSGKNSQNLKQYRREIEIIEQSAIEADSGIYKYIIKNVTEGIPFKYMPVPCCKKYFYKARDRFFEILSEQK